MSLAAALREAEHDAKRAKARLDRAADAVERARLEAVARQTREQVAELRSQAEAAERQIGAAPRSDPGRAAAIERILAQRRLLRTEAAIRLEPRYLTDGLGPRPEGLSERLEWERAVDRLERRRQRLGVDDRERALGEEPETGGERAEWRAGRRELERMRERFAERVLEREAEREQVLELAIER